jgi:hypothetical protein
MKNLPGSYYNRRDRVWYSRIVIDGKVKMLGTFKSELDASNKYLEFKSELIRNQLKEKYSEYRDIPGYENRYLINEDGMIISCINPNILEIKPTQNRKGYLTVSLANNWNKKWFFVHRLVYLSFVGEIPKEMCIDHTDRNKQNNNIKNLRLVTNSKNSINSDVVDKARGYFKRKSDGVYQAQIKSEGEYIYLGRFIKEEDARLAYVQAKEKYHKVKVPE